MSLLSFCCMAHEIKYEEPTEFSVSRHSCAFLLTQSFAICGSQAHRGPENDKEGLKFYLFAHKRM